MAESKWDTLPLSDAARRILNHIPSRAMDRGLYVVDGEAIVTLTLWSLLCWERKLGLTALERTGVDRFALARGVDGLLSVMEERESVVFDQRLKTAVVVRTGEPFKGWEFGPLIEPLLLHAEQEAAGLGNNWIGSEHLLLAILRTADASLKTLLKHHAADYGRVKAAVSALLPDSPPESRSRLP